MSEYFVDEMSGIIDEEKKITHKALGLKIEAKIEDSKFFDKLARLPKGFDSSQLDWAYGPIVQSGGNYDLKLSAENDSNNLHAGIIIAGFGFRYKTYASMILRTYLVDPNKSQEANYKLLQNIHAAVLADMRDGAVAKDIYNKALGMVRAKKPELEKNFLKNIGSSIGLEMKDPNFVIHSKNSRTLKNGMVICLMVGFTDVENPDAQDKKSKIYSMVIADTVRIADDNTHVFTKDAGIDTDTVSFYFNDEEEQPTPKKEKKTGHSSAMATKNITKTKLRADRQTQVNEDAEARRREHQKELAAKKQQEGVSRFAEATGDQNGTDQKKFKRFESFKREQQVPVPSKNELIIVDRKTASIVVPIMGRPVPFHINTIKNASKSDEGEYAYLRINFLSPGQSVGRKDDQPFEDPNAHFLRNLTLRSKEADRLATVAQEITDLRKDTLKREQEKKEFEDVVEQDKLVELRSTSSTAALRRKVHC